MTLYGLYHSESLVYPTEGAPFRPSRAYPEYPFPGTVLSSAPNEVYDGVRQLFKQIGLDDLNYDTPDWNPLGIYVKPGNKVLVKPNFVMHINPTGKGTDCLYTHPSIVAAVIDYIVVALEGRGDIVLADAPMQSCDFEQLATQSGLNTLVHWYQEQGVSICLKDMRGLRSSNTALGLIQQVSDESTGKVIDLGQASSFYGLSEERIDSFRITDYDPAELKKHHSLEKHEYYVSSELLEANVVFNLPKGKTHRKAGITGALKNMVGVNVRKEYLPHHSNGSRDEGFDEYGRKSRLKEMSESIRDEKTVGCLQAVSL